MSSSIPRAESALFYALNGETGHCDESRVSIREVAGFGYLVLRGDSEGRALTSGVSTVLDVELPPRPDRFVQADDIRVFGVGPDEWLLQVPTGEEHSIETRLRDRLTGHFAVTDVTGGYTAIKLSGAEAPLVLAKSCSYDLHPAKFGVGNAVQTAFAATSALIARTGDSEYQIVTRRSFADYIAAWAADAAREYRATANEP